MASNTLPVEELRNLLSAVSDHGEQHLLEVESDLVQTTYLLSEAIEKLGDSFMAIHQAVTDQQAEIDALLEAAKVPGTTHQNILDLREKIATEVNAAVTGLQFQDMTSQLINRVIKRVDGLKESLIALADHGRAMDPQHEHEEIVSLLEKMNSNLKDRHGALHDGLIKSVRQQDMDSGDIELF